MNITDPLSFFMPGTNGKAVLLIHGLTGAPAEMRLVARHLNRRGYTIYAPLLAGHGKDVTALRATSWRDWLQSVDRSVAKLANHANEVYAAGICVGGKLALMSAHRNPGAVKAVALYSPCFDYDGWNVPFYYPLLSRQIRWLAHVPFLDRLSFAETSAMGIKDDRLRRMMASMSSEGVLERFPGKGIVEMHRLGDALKEQLADIQIPTLIMHAREDDLSDPRHAEYINNHIGAPHELQWIDDSYHMIHVDRQHRHVADATAKYFEEAHAHQPM